MSNIFDARLTKILISALVVVLILLSPVGKEFPVSLIFKGMHVADTLFHECGHALFNWLFGLPSFPAIFTIIQVQDAGGVAWTMDRTWIVQIGAYIALAYWCYRTWNNNPMFFVPMVIFSLIIVVMSFTNYYRVLVLFMGHGSSILVGAFFLFRAILRLGPKPLYERWLNAFFGLWLIISNMNFGYELVYNHGFYSDYIRQSPVGGTHDFFALTDIVWGWTVKGIAWFTMIFGGGILIGVFLLAAWLKGNFEDENYNENDQYYNLKNYNDQSDLMK